jgi:adenylate kinase family enzyme
MPENDNQTALRVHIVGSPGCGKSTLARRLGSITNAPFYDLDDIGYEGGAGPERPLSERLDDIRRIAAETSWVTEGAYLGWTAPLFATADIIVWLDLSWHVCAWRIVVRHVKASLMRTNRHPGLLNLFRFLQWTRRYHTASPIRHGGDVIDARAATADYVASFSDKLVWCRRQQEVDALVQSIY